MSETILQAKINFSADDSLLAPVLERLEALPNAVRIYLADALEETLEFVFVEFDRDAAMRTLKTLVIPKPSDVFCNALAAAEAIELIRSVRANRHKNPLSA